MVRKLNFLEFLSLWVPGRTHLGPAGHGLLDKERELRVAFEHVAAVGMHAQCGMEVLCEVEQKYWSRSGVDSYDEQQIVHFMHFPALLGADSERSGCVGDFSRQCVVGMCGSAWTSTSLWFGFATLQKRQPLLDEMNKTTVKLL